MKTSLLPIVLLLFASRCAASQINITTTSVPNGVLATSYSAVISASGGCTPYTWAVSGSLPSGVTSRVSGKTAALSLNGTPTVAGTYSFTASVTGCRGRVSQITYTIVVQSTSDHVVALTWIASTSSDVAGYNVYRGPDGVHWRKMNAGLVASTTFSDSTVANGSIYFYTATAVDIYGKESVKTAAMEAAVP